MRIPDRFAALLLDTLRAREREVLGLHFLQQFSVAEIAHLLEMKPDSISGHLSKGVRSVASILDATPDEARDVLDALGEFTARRRPKQTLTMGKEALRVEVLPHREMMGAAIRPDEHLFTHTLRYFVTGVNDRPLNVEEAEQWVLHAPVAFGSSVVRELLAIKQVKPRVKYDKEISMYFWPTAFGCAEIYYEHDFDHQPRTLPLPEGQSILDLNHQPPVPADKSNRSALVPQTWPFRVVDLGEYAKAYDDAMAEDTEHALKVRVNGCRERRTW